MAIQHFSGSNGLNGVPESRESCAAPELARKWLSE